VAVGVPVIHKLDTQPVEASLLAMASSAPRLFSSNQLALTTIASKLAPTVIALSEFAGITRDPKKRGAHAPPRFKAFYRGC
jgi:hypothetical protein